MSVLDNLSPGQRQLLMYGAPVVGIFALISFLGKKNAPATAAVTGATQPTALPNASAIGVGELAQYESAVTAAIGSLQAQVANLPAATTTTIVNQTTAPTPLPPIDHSAYPLVGEPGSAFAVLGQITGSGGIYTGENIGGGAPVYYQVPGTNQWVQNLDPNKVPVGTKLATPQQFSQYIVNGTVTEDL